MDRSDVIKSRRHLMQAAGIASAAAIVMPTQWKKPLLNSVLVPAHAMTSNACGVFADEPISDVINMVVSATDIQGPITVPIIAAAFSGTESSILGNCTNGDVQRQEVSFSGQVNSGTSQITGALEVDIFCGDVLICQQRTTFVADQMPANPRDSNGLYQGPLVGTLSCCEQSTVLLKRVIGRSLVR